MLLFKCKLKLILATLPIFFFAIYSSAYANNIYCDFTDLKIELKSVEKLPPELSGVKLNGNIIGDGSLIIEIQKVYEVGTSKKFEGRSMLQIVKINF